MDECQRSMVGAQGPVEPYTEKWHDLMKRMFPEDCEWINNKETLKEWPEWFLKDDVERPTGRYTFVASKHYSKDGPIYYKDEDPLYSSGLLGPVRIYTSGFQKGK